MQIRTLNAHLSDSPFRPLGWAIMMLWVAPALVGQQWQTIDVNDHRPMAAAVDEIEAATGVAVHYEDAPLENEEDLEDVSSPQQKAEIPGYRLLVPRRAALSFELDIESTQADPAGAVRSAIGAYERTGVSGKFDSARMQDGSLVVVSREVRDAFGAPKSVESPLSVVVNLASEDRTVFDTFVALLQQISAASGTLIEPGAIPGWPTHRIRFGATRESGRDALTRLIRESWEAPVSYRLLHDPLLKYYMLNLQPVISDETLTHPSKEAATETGPLTTTDNPFFVPDQP